MSRVKCKHCGNFINQVKCHVFAYDGQDSFIKAPIRKQKVKGSCHYIEVPKNATMFRFESYDEFTESISCPVCDKYPFEGSVETHEFAHVVFGISEEKTLNGVGEENG